MDHIETILDDFETRVQKYVNDNMTTVKADDIGLDSRCGLVNINDDCIIVGGNRRMVDYYGGFEYIDSSYVNVVGRYTIYFAGTDRVDECIDEWKNKVTED